MIRSEKAKTVNGLFPRSRATFEHYKKRMFLFSICIFSLCVSPSYAQQMIPICLPVDNPPYIFHDEDGVRRGFDIAVLQAMELPYSIEFITTDFATGLAMLDNGSCHMLLSSRMITQRLQDRFLFSESHLQSNLHALVLEQSPLDSNEDLISSIVGVLKGSPAEKYAFDSLKNGIIYALRHEDSLIDLLENGEVEALLGDKVFLQKIIQNVSGTHILEPSLKEQYYGYLFSKKQKKFRDEVSLKIKHLKDEGLLTALYEEWFENTQNKSDTNSKETL